MKKSTILLLLILPLFIQSQDAPAYAMWRNIYITPEKGKVMDMEAKMAAHNKTYHNAGPYHVNVYRVTSGANFTKLVWSMGPHTWADIDARVASDEHGQDWLGNIVANAESIEDGGIWRLAPGQSYLPDGKAFDKLRVRIINVKRGENYRFNTLMENLAEAYKQKRPGQAHALFVRVGATNDGRERVVVFGYDNWAQMDKGIARDYEAVHGEGSWDDFQEEVEEVIASSNDELWLRIAAMSGDAD